MIRLAIAGRLPAGVDATKLRTAVRLLYKQTGFTLSGEIGLRFVTKAKSRELNRTYAGHDYPTDVLSFDYEAAHRPAIRRHVLPLGDVVICTSIACKQARAHDITLQQEVALLTVHGAMHVLGFDHHSSTARAGFRRLQNAIMETLGSPAREYFDDYA